jgi:hypothetical protein
MRVAKPVPAVSTERIMDLSEVIAARDAIPYRPAWVGIFAKAYAMVAREFPPLRRTFVKWPWPHLYEYPVSSAAITINRDYNGEPCVVPLVIKDPASLPIKTISGMVDEYATAPMTSIRSYQRLIAIGRLPGVFRRPIFWFGFNSSRQRANHFGTFGITSVSFTRSELVYVPSPGTSVLTFGVFGDDGRTPVRIMVDHRVMDGMAFAAILTRLEEVLNGPMLEELRSEAAATSPSETQAESYIRRRA